MRNNLKAGLLSAAMAGAMGAGIVMSSDAPAQAEDKIKCYGVAKAGQNDCGAADGSHSCAGQATKDHDHNEWKFMSEEECKEMHGGLTPEEAAANHASHHEEGDHHHDDGHNHGDHHEEGDAK